MDIPWKRFTPLLSIVVFVNAVWSLYHEISRYHWRDIEESVAEIPSSKIALAGSLVFLNHSVFIGCDWIALKAIKVRRELIKVALASFAGFVASYNFWNTPVGTPVRYRTYAVKKNSNLQSNQPLDKTAAARINSKSKRVLF